MRIENKVLKQKFYTKFKLELSIQLLSKEEFSEDLSFIKLTLKSPKIVLIDKLNIK
jgi:hypothetical protein